MNSSRVTSEIEFATWLAKKVGKILVDTFHQGKYTYYRKQDHTLVTQADLAADEMIHQELQKNFSEDFILSEEVSPKFDASSSRGWIIDPLDGTTNFALGLHYWGILISRVEGGSPSFTIQYFPLLNELYQASDSEPATLNGKIIHVEDQNNDQKISFFSCCSRAHRKYDINLRYKTRIFGSAGYSMASVARGAARLAFDAQAKIWDIAGAWILVRQAGGVIAPIHGNSPFPLRELDYTAQDFAILAASSPTFLKEGLDKIHRKSI